ncbi:hypothetical protein GCM10009557_30250 [Virgisporangium ochraceum]
MIGAGRCVVPPPGGEVAGVVGGVLPGSGRAESFGAAPVPGGRVEPGKSEAKRS